VEKKRKIREHGKRSALQDLRRGVGELDSFLVCKESHRVERRGDSLTRGQNKNPQQGKSLDFIISEKIKDPATEAEARTLRGGRRAGRESSRVHYQKTFGEKERWSQALPFTNQLISIRHRGGLRCSGRFVRNKTPWVRQPIVFKKRAVWKLEFREGTGTECKRKPNISSSTVGRRHWGGRSQLSRQSKGLKHGGDRGDSILSIY